MSALLPQPSTQGLLRLLSILPVRGHVVRLCRTLNNAGTMLLQRASLRAAALVRPSFSQPSLIDPRPSTDPRLTLIQ